MPCVLFIVALFLFMLSLSRPKKSYHLKLKLIKGTAEKR